MKKRAKPWPLPRLAAANRNAMAVYMSLVWRADGKRQVFPTREWIGETIGLRDLETVSAAMAALAAANWITLRYRRVGVQTMYRITIRAGNGLIPGAGFSGHRGDRNNEPLCRKKSGTGGTSRAGKNPLQGSKPCTGKNPLPPLRGRAADSGSAIAMPDLPRETQEEQGNGTPRTTAEIVREALARRSAAPGGAA